MKDKVKKRIIKGVKHQILHNSSSYSGRLRFNLPTIFFAAVPLPNTLLNLFGFSGLFSHSGSSIFSGLFGL